MLCWRCWLKSDNESDSKLTSKLSVECNGETVTMIYTGSPVDVLYRCLEEENYSNFITLEFSQEQKTGEDAGAIYFKVVA